jgi:CheY-specific phosphatase CheX
MTITQDDLHQLTRVIWQSTLRLEVRPIAESSFLEQGARLVVGRVQITGAWPGTVLLECSEKLAKDVARIMFDLDSREPVREEVRDAMAEITNITAGNFKSLVGADCHLSMPQVTDHMHDQLATSKDVVISRQAFDCQGESFAVTISEGQARVDQGDFEEV